MECHAAESIDECLHEAKISAEITHNHPEGVRGAQAAAVAVFLARKGRTKAQIKKYIESKLGYDLSRKYADIQPKYKFDVSCQKSVPESIICFLESNSWEDTIRKCIAIGGDCDTMACVAGNIAEAYYGELSKEITDRVKEYMPNSFVEIVDQFNKRFGN